MLYNLIYIEKKSVQIFSGAKYGKKQTKKKQTNKQKQNKTKTIRRIRHYVMRSTNCVKLYSKILCTGIVVILY